MRAVSPILLILAAACATAPPRATPPVPVLAITGATVVDATGAPPREGMTVVIEGDRIREVAPSGAVEIPRRAQVVNAAGKYLIPGLWDTHVHLSFASADALPLFIAHGVTSVRDLGGRFETVRAMRERVRSGEAMGPRIFTSGATLEGAAWMRAAHQLLPPDDPMWAAAPRVTVSRENARAVVDSLVAEGVDLIKARNVWGEDFLALAAATERVGIPLASHNPNRVSMLDAVRAGLDSFEHAESIWGDFDTLSTPARQRMFEQVAETEVLVAPTLMADVGYASPEGAILAAVADTLGRLDPRSRTLPEPMRAAWAEALRQRKLHGAAPEGTFEKITRDVRSMNEAGIPMLAGTDVGAIPLVYPGAGLHEELQLLVDEGGLTPMEALQSATRNPPRFFGRGDQTGTIEPGRAADLVLLDADPLADIRNTQRIHAVVLDGRYLGREALDALLAAERAVGATRMPGS